jgi:Integrase core domain/Chitobiase/beta-hexosaminidase C-terminal domain
LDGSAPSSASLIYTAPITTASSGEIRAAAFVQDRALADPRSRQLDAAALARLASTDGLLPCKTKGGLLLRLPIASATAGGPDNVVLLDLFDPCWMIDRCCGIFLASDVSDQVGTSTIDVWRWDYNESRPHRSLERLTPWEFAVKQAFIGVAISQA